MVRTIEGLRFNAVEVYFADVGESDVTVATTAIVASEGLVIAAHNGYLVEALTFQSGFIVIGTGMWLGLIMAAIVWFVIWPNQKIALGIVEGTAEQKAAAGKTAMIFSRTNFVLSFPMLYCMVAQANGLTF